MGRSRCMRIAWRLTVGRRRFGSYHFSSGHIVLLGCDRIEARTWLEVVEGCGNSAFLPWQIHVFGSIDVRPDA